MVGCTSTVLVNSLVGIIEGMVTTECGDTAIGRILIYAMKRDCYQGAAHRRCHAHSLVSPLVPAGASAVSIGHMVVAQAAGGSDQ